TESAGILCCRVVGPEQSDLRLFYGPHRAGRATKQARQVVIPPPQRTVQRCGPLQNRINCGAHRKRPHLAYPGYPGGQKSRGTWRPCAGSGSRRVGHVSLQSIARACRYHCCCRGLANGYSGVFGGSFVLDGRERSLEAPIEISLLRREHVWGTNKFLDFED